MKVFVYGTLKQGYGNHRVMEMSGGRFLYRAMTEIEFDLISLGGFPGMIPGEHRVLGEVYEVDRIGPLDSLEGHPSFYRRTPITVSPLDISHVRDRNPVEVLAYIYQRRQDGRGTDRDITVNGNTKSWDRSHVSQEY